MTSSDSGLAGRGEPLGVREPITRALLRLAVPILASQVLRLAYQWVDALWVRGLGVDATAAVTTSVFVMWAMYSLNDIFAIGGVAYVSQLLGAGERRRAGVAAWVALRGSMVIGLVGTVAGVFAAGAIFGLMTQAPGALDQGTRYLSIVLAGSPFFLIALTGESIMRASGDSRTPLVVDACAIGLNIVLDPLMIYGVGPFPAMGVAGAAWATVIAQAVMAAAYLTLGLRKHPAFPLAASAEGPPVRFAGMVRVGVPAALIGTLFSVVYITFGAAAGRISPEALAIVGIVNRLEALEYLTAVAVGLAGASLVGQNLGAGRPDRAVQVIRIGVRWVAVFSLVLSAVMFAVPELFLRLFTNDEATVALGVPYLRIMATCFVFNGIEIVTAESILGSGHTTAISVIFGSFSLLRIPLAFVAPGWFDLGVLGIAWVIAVTCVVRALVIVAWAARGTWKSGLGSELQTRHPMPEASGAG